MAPKPATHVLKLRIEEELATVDARADELRIALKVVSEFGTTGEIELEPETEADLPTNEPETEPKRIILKPTDDVPDAVKSRLEGTEAGRKLADKTFDLERA